MYQPVHPKDQLSRKGGWYTHKLELTPHLAQSGLCHGLKIKDMAQGL
uniref:Uncharacterized protein n=1 Tax=Arundo donax TaxID=35708 RepID=A0A0A9AM03_ARUDO